MANRLPYISGKHKICIICEGNEEYKYLERLNQLHVWNEIYDISLVNAEGNGNIPARYQDRYQNGSYETVLVFCDSFLKLDCTKTHTTFGWEAEWYVDEAIRNTVEWYKAWNNGEDMYDFTRRQIINY